MATRDFFAELYVAGIMGDAGWSVYFPKRDVGFDFIVSKKIGNEILIRPVQVKGLYPSVAKKDKSGYGFIGNLTQLHRDMVLVLPYFPTDETGLAPTLIAYMPRREIREQASRGYACRPAKFTGGVPQSRPKFARYFGAGGLALIESPAWGDV